MISQTENAVQVNGAPLTTTISAANSTLLTGELDNRIVKVRPMATPIDQLSRCGDIRHAGSMRVNYYEVDMKPVSTTVSEAPDRDAVAQPDETTVLLTVNVANAAIFSVSDTVLLPDVDDNGHPAMLYLTEVDGTGGCLTGKLINTGSDGSNVRQAIQPGTKVVRMGRAASELDVQTSQFETLPKRNYNFCQIFKMQVEESTLHRLSNKEASWNFSDQEEVAIIDMRQGMEKNFIFGQRAQFTGGANNDDIYLTGGIWNQNLATYTYDPAKIDEGELVAICRKAFTGSGGASRKILIGGSDFVEALSRLPHTRVLENGATYTRWGLEFNEIKSNFGTLYLIHSEIFDQCGHSADAMVIDPQMLTKYVHIPFSTEKLDLRSSGQRNTDAVVITEASCLVLRNPASHLRIVAKPVGD